MLRIATILLLISVSFTVNADRKEDSKAFKQAYGNYQQAVADGKRTDALENAKLAYEYGLKLFGEDHKNVAALTLNYGRLIPKNKKAEPILQLAVERFEKIYGSNAPEMIDPLMDLAEASARYGQISDAKRHYRRAMKIAETQYQGDNHILGVLNLEMGRIALEEAQAQSSLVFLERAKEVFAADDTDIGKMNEAETDFLIGKYNMADRNYAAAETHLTASLDVFERFLPNDRLTMTNHAFLIRVYEEQGQRDEATKHCRAIGQKKPLKADQDYMPVYQTFPEYPYTARRRGLEGYAIVELTVDKDGFVKDPVVVENKGYGGFKNAATKAASKFRYAPRYENGKPVETLGVRYKFSFNMN